MDSQRSSSQFEGDAISDVDSRGGDVNNAAAIREITEKLELLARRSAEFETRLEAALWELREHVELLAGPRSDIDALRTELKQFRDLWLGRIPVIVETAPIETWASEERPE